MLHPRDREQPVEVVDVRASILGREVLNSLIVMDAAARADDLVSPSDVVEKLPSTPNKRTQIGIDRLQMRVSRGCPDTTVQDAHQIGLD